jgi:hypothetical protein
MVSIFKHHMANAHLQFAREVFYVEPSSGTRDRSGILTSVIEPRVHSIEAHIKWQPTPEQVTAFGDVPFERVQGLLTTTQPEPELKRQGSIIADGKKYSILAVTHSPLDTFYRVLIGVE